MQSEGDWMSLRLLRSHGWSLSALAREFHLNWRTVKREVKSPAATRRGADRRRCRKCRWHT
jgi:hypothetical protein